MNLNSAIYIINKFLQTAPKVPIKFVQLPSFSTILPHTTSIFTAELLAVLLALSNIHKTHYNFHILFSDSFSALQAINHNSSKNPIVLDILLKYNNLINHHYDLIFGWIPGHVGIKGNIEADKLARDMSNVITHILPIYYLVLALDLEGVHDLKLHHPSSSVATSNQ